MQDTKAVREFNAWVKRQVNANVSPLPPDPEGENPARAARGLEMLRGYAGVCRTDPQDVLKDGLCAIMHYCDRTGESFDAALVSAGRHYRAETEDQNAVPALIVDGNSCPKCGGHSFTIAATFDGTVAVTFKPAAGDPADFEVTESNPTDSEWDRSSPVECDNCDWDGNVCDLVLSDQGEDAEVTVQ